MPQENRYVVTLPSLTLAVITLNCQDGDPDEEWLLTKTLFELSRPLLDNPKLSGKELEEWRSTVQFEYYMGDIPLDARQIKESDLPTERDPVSRAKWEDTGTQVRVKPQ